MRQIFHAPVRQRPFRRYLWFPWLLACWLIRELQEGADELWDARNCG